MQIIIHESYIPSNGPRNGSGSKVGYGWTRASAHQDANHHNNQSCFAKTRRVILFDSPQISYEKNEQIRLAYDAYGSYLEIATDSYVAQKRPVPVNEKLAWDLYRQERYASAYVALKPPPKRIKIDVAGLPIAVAMILVQRI